MRDEITLWAVKYDQDGNLTVVQLVGVMYGDCFHPDPNPHFQGYVYLPTATLRSTREETIRANIDILKDRGTNIQKQLDENNVYLAKFEALLT